MRTLDELVDRADPALPLIQPWLAAARPGAELLPCTHDDGAETLLRLQVTTRSPMGALAFGSGGLLVDRGWLRILGAGCARFPRSIASWNRLGEPAARLPGALLVADDVLGGFFALSGGGLPCARGNVCYLAPDTLRWEDLGIGYSSFVEWALCGAVATFYQANRWPGWEAEAAQVPGDRGLSVYPFLFTAGAPIAERSRRGVPLEELWQLHAAGLFEAY